MGDTDMELLARYIRQHAEDAFAELVRRHLGLVYSAALRQVRSPQLAEDVAQSAFIDLARSAIRLKPDTILIAWLYQVTRRTAIDVVRREASRQLREQIATEMNAMNATGADWTDIEPLLDEAMHALDDTHRAAVLLRYFENKSLREVGETLGTSENAAQKRLGRAVERLRAFFTKRGVSVGASGLVVVISANAVQAAPVGLAITVSTVAALAETTVSTSVTAATTKAIAMTTLQKSLIGGALGLVLIGGVGKWLVDRSTGARPLPASAAAPLPATAEANPAPANSVSGIVRTPDGKPLPAAEVLLSTFSTAVPVYSAPSLEVGSTVTGRDGRFSFSASPENRAVIVVSDQGYGQATVAELAARAEITLQPWARVEGTLRKGTTPLANQTIRLSRTRFGSKLQEQAYRTVHDIRTKTDAAGRYAFPRVAPGDAWISWRTDQGGYELQYRYFDIRPGETLTADIGGRGRAVTGRAVLADSDAPVKFFGSVWPKTPHQMRRPPNWSELSPEEQNSLTAAWEMTPDAKLYNQERCPIDFRLAADGTFTVPDLPAGAYRITVASWTGAPVASRMVSRGTAEITIGEMPTGRSDEPLEIDEIVAYATAPLQPGDSAPLFETITLDGKPLKLADHKGKYILLNFWRTDVPESLDELPNLKAVESTWGQDKRFVLIGLNFDATLAAARQYATNHGLTWTQCFPGKTSDLPMRYRLRRPTTLLIGPDGLILEPQLTGPAIRTAVEDVLAAK